MANEQILKQCPTCGGDGVVEETVLNEEPIEKECVICKGTGHIYWGKIIK